MTAALRIDRVDDLVFRAEVRLARARRVFGGQIIAQALLAAGRTLSSELGVHLLQARFLRPGDPELPIDYTIDAADDRGAFAHRRVVATQGDVRILDMTASFHRSEDGPGHQIPTAVASDPEGVPTFTDLARDCSDEATRRWWGRLQPWLPVEVRAPVVPGRWRPAAGDDVEPRQHVWFRSNDPLGDDPLAHGCAAVYASDLFLLTAGMVRHGLRHDDQGVLAVTLNHTMWFHEPFRTDEWWLYEQEGSWSGAGRMLCRGQMFNRAGRLVATVKQEGLLRADADSVRIASDRLAG
jgi:acyl-CoA thioesterase-2